MHLPNLPIILGRWSRLAEEKQAAAYPIQRSTSPCHLLEAGPASTALSSAFHGATASHWILALTVVVTPLPGMLHKENWSLHVR